MTINLDPIYVSDSQLFKTLVYDEDGVTPITPSSCVCSIWNRDTDAAIITDQSGTVGAGYAQFNWSGIASAANYEAVLTVTISTGVVKSEHFLVEVRAKPPAFTLDVSSSIGQMRVLIPDRDAAHALFADGELNVFLSLSGQDVMRAAALALETLASDQVMVLKVIRILDLSTDGASVARALLERATRLREQASETEASAEALFDFAELDLNAFTARDIVWNKRLREQ